MLLFIQLSLQILHFGITFYKYNVGSGIKKNLGFRYWKCKCWTRRFSHGMHLFWITDPRMRHPKENEKSVSTLLGVSHHFQEKKKVGVASKSDLLLFLLCDDALFVLLKARHFSKENDFPSLSLFFLMGHYYLRWLVGVQWHERFIPFLLVKKTFFEL